MALTVSSFFLAGLGVLSVVTAICVIFNIISFWAEKKAATAISEGKFRIFLLLFAVTRTLSFAFHNFYQEFKKNLDVVRTNRAAVVEAHEAEISAAEAELNLAQEQDEEEAE